jgi:hypothetical protein
MFIWYSQHGLIYYVDYMSIYINMWKIQMNPYIYMGYNMIYIYMDSSEFIWIDIWIHVEHILTISNFRVLKSWGIPKSPWVRH